MAGNSASAGSGRVLSSLAAYSKAEMFSASSSEVRERPQRLEADYYGSDGFRAVESLSRSGFELSTIGAVAKELRWFGGFSRVYIQDPRHGVPFLNSSSMMSARMRPELLIPKNHPGLDRLLVREGWILISRSGTIGNTMYCTRDVDGWGCSQDAMRVIVEGDWLGPTYCYLQSAGGQFLLQQGQSGSVVTHLYGPDVARLQVPRLPKALRQHLTDLVHQAADLRVEANRLLDRAEEMVYKQNYIEQPEPEAHGQSQTMVVPSSRLRTTYEGRRRLRLDATFQATAPGLIADRIRRGSWRRLGDVATIPFAGPGSLPGVHKVDMSNGTPTLTGRDLRRARPVPSYYLNSPKPHLVAAMVPSPGTTLVLCAGTLGFVDYVADQYANWCVSLDVIRVIPKRGEISPGYLHAFLSTELGRVQMLRHTYGSVIPRIHSRQIAEIAVPVPKDKGALAGEKVDAAFSKRHEAVLMENAGIETFMQAVRSGRRATEAEWGGDY